MVERAGRDSAVSRGRWKTGSAASGDGGRASALVDVEDFPKAFSGLIARGTGYWISEILPSQDGGSEMLLATSIPKDDIETRQLVDRHGAFLNQLTADGVFAPAYRDAAGDVGGGSTGSRFSSRYDSGKTPGDVGIPDMRYRLLIPFAGPAGRIWLVEFFGAEKLDPQERDSLVNQTLFYLMGKLHTAGRGAAEQLASLNAKELECLRWAADGKTSSEIAIITGLSEHTVNHYLIFVCNKLNAVNRAHAVAKAIRAGII